MRFDPQASFLGHSFKLQNEDILNINVQSDIEWLVNEATS